MGSTEITSPTPSLALSLDNREANKYDDSKIRTDLLPTDALESVAEILTHGAQKYEERNWELGMSWGRVYGALLRHLFRFWGGENVDPDSGKPHVAHAACCALMLLAYYLRGTGKDDRHK